MPRFDRSIETTRPNDEPYGQAPEYAHLMLRPEPQVVQRWQFNGWNGTPRQLADAVAAIRHLLPEADFRATVKALHGPVQVADEPEGLAAIPLELRFDMIDIDLDEHRRRLGSQWDYDYYWVKLRFRRTDTWNDILCRGENELQSRTMIQAAKEALTPGIPWHVRIKGAVVWKGVAAALCALLMAAGVGLVVRTETSSLTAGRVSVVGWLLAFLLALPAIEWLLPSFELHMGKPRRRRFAWGFLTLAVLPLVVGLLLR